MLGTHIGKNVIKHPPSLIGYPANVVEPSRLWTVILSSCSLSEFLCRYYKKMFHSGDSQDKVEKQR